MNKAEAIYQAIQSGLVGSDVIVHNNDGSVFCILTIKCKEHPEHNISGRRCSIHKWDSQNLWCEVCGELKERKI